MISVLLVTPAWRRPQLTRIMLEARLRTEAACLELGVRCATMVIADDENYNIAEELGHLVSAAPNVLGAKFNDGYETAVDLGYDWAFHVNSDQVFDPRLIAAIAASPQDHCVRTRWLTAVRSDGGVAISYRNPVRAMQAFPTRLLRRQPRPCAEDIMSGCDRSTWEGVARANPTARVHTVEVGPYESVQFESDVQLTGWDRNLAIGFLDGRRPRPTPWEDLRQTYGPELARDMHGFYYGQDPDPIQQMKVGDLHG